MKYGCVCDWVVVKMGYVIIFGECDFVIFDYGNGEIDNCVILGKLGQVFIQFLIINRCCESVQVKCQKQCKEVNEVNCEYGCFLVLFGFFVFFGDYFIGIKYLVVQDWYCCVVWVNWRLDIVEVYLYL